MGQPRVNWGPPFEDTLHFCMTMASGVGRLHLNDIKALHGEMLLMWTLVPIILPE